MVTIRLSRTGSKKRPFYHIVVTDKRMPQGGRYIERLGFFNPLAKGTEERLRIDLERVAHWRSHGAQLTDRALVDSYRKAVASAEASQPEAA